MEATDFPVRCTNRQRCCLNIQASLLHVIRVSGAERLHLIKLRVSLLCRLIPQREEVTHLNVHTVGCFSLVDSDGGTTSVELNSGGGGWLFSGATACGSQHAKYK